MRIKSVDLQVNPLFFLVLFLFSFAGMLGQVVIAFLAVLVHETAHILIAKRLGFGVRKVQLLPFGGVTWFEELLELNPEKEVTIALAGPITNIFLALASGFSIYFGWLTPHRGLHLFETNLVIGLFNLVPAFPLDGGRVVRALLSTKLGMKEATEKIACWSKFLAFLFAGLSIWGLVYHKANFLLLLIAFFVYYNALRHSEQALYLFLHFLTKKEEIIRRKEALPVESLVAFEDKPFYQFLRYLNADSFYILYLLDSSLKIRGKLTEIDLLQAFREGDSTASLKDIWLKKGI